MESKIIYHEQVGPDNTAATLGLAVEVARERGIETLVVASRSGATAMELMERIGGEDIRMVAVSPQYGWMEEHEFDRSLIPRLRDAGHAFYAGTMPFHTDAFHGCSATERMGDVLRIFCQGLQVCVEIAMMAADGGLLRCDRPCVAIAGTGRRLIRPSLPPLPHRPSWRRCGPTRFFATRFWRARSEQARCVASVRCNAP